MVFQLAQGGTDHHASALRNVANVLDALPGVEVRVVAHGEGIDFVTDTAPHAETLNGLVDAGVGFAACSNTLTRKGIDPERLLPGVFCVPAGLAEIIELQHAGWAYIRP